MKAILALLVLAAAAAADDLHVRLELDSGLRRELILYDRTTAGARARHGSTDSASDPATWTEKAVTAEEGAAFEALLAAEGAWTLEPKSEETAGERGGKVITYVPLCRLTLEDDTPKRHSVVLQPFSPVADTPFARVAAALRKLARPAPPGRGIEFSYRQPIVDHGYTLTLEMMNDRVRISLRAHLPTGEWTDPIVKEGVPADFEAAWTAIQETTPWQFGDVAAEEGEGDRYDVRIWNDGLEHRWRILHTRETGVPPQKQPIATVMAVKGVKGFRDAAMEEFRERQLQERVERLYGDWTSGGPELREDAVRALREISAQALPILRELVKSERSDKVRTRGEDLIQRLEQK